MRSGATISPELGELVRLERLAFAAKLRIARAVLGWSQIELGSHVGLTQRAIHMLEQGDTEPRRTTLYAIEALWRSEGIEFEDLGGGGFAAIVRNPVLQHASARPFLRAVKRRRTMRKL